MTGHAQHEITALVRDARRGDPLATNQLIELFAPYVGKLCGPIATQGGPDAAQEALLATFRNLHHLREPATLFGWARTIAVRKVVRFTTTIRNPIPADWPTCQRLMIPAWPPTFATCYAGCPRSIAPC